MRFHEIEFQIDAESFGFLCILKNKEFLKPKNNFLSRTAKIDPKDGARRWC